ncbi:MAG: hypothetical protein HKN97_02790 [Myxococcales bacterium]|nr:hypothetical protein [Myxococcales bacterium]RZV50683.1 MAG: hypothetical protein EX268_16430 [Deltaproteobacteria bacterium]
MGRQLMKYVGIMLSALLLISASASAQEDTATQAPATDAQPASATPSEPAAEAPQEDKRSPYYKKVQGWLWLEAVAGPSSYDPDQFGALSLGTRPGGAPKKRGSQWGFSLGTGFGGGFFLGWYYRQANYSEYKLFKTGLEFQPTIRIPYVHIMFRVNIGLARMFSGNAWGLTDVNNGGVDTTFGVGLRIPIVRWMSFAANFDWSYIGLRMRGTDTSGTRVESWVSGQQLAGTFALTFHFIGVRKN